MYSFLYITFSIKQIINLNNVQCNKIILYKLNFKYYILISINCIILPFYYLYNFQHNDSNYLAEL